MLEKKSVLFHKITIALGNEADILCISFHVTYCWFVGKERSGVGVWLKVLQRFLKGCKIFVKR